MSDAIVAQVAEQMAALPDHLQRTVLAFVHALEAGPVRRLSGRELAQFIRTMQAVVHALEAGSPRGLSGADLAQFVGAIPSDDLRIMADAIEAGCEQVDQDEW